MKLTEIAASLGGQVKGNGNLEIQGVRDLELIGGQGRDTAPQAGYIYYVESKKVFNQHPESVHAEALLTTKTLSGNFANAVVVEDAQARVAFIRLLAMFEQVPAPVAAEKGAAYIAPDARVDASAIVMHGAVILPGAEIGANAVIHPNAVIEQNVKIGAHTVIHPNVVIKFNCVIGSHCIIHSSTVIGADGFGFYDKDGVRYKVPQIGNVIVGDHVEMGASVTVDRATIESTVIGDYTKFDDQVHVGHNCQVGKYVYIAGNTVLAGSVTLEDNVTLGGQTAISGKVLVRKGSFVMGMSALAADSEPGGMYFGIPARPAREMHKINGSLVYVPELLKRVAALEEKLGLEKNS
ncbi:MAG TPA: UDP-3-O-(3-hydroxymyristoyl)glucosamine N-acyltransferase [Turneriella sp.]|nr:UDP-3-O-(3-hydroxymyristoyl)glucosamine N-acyltransferase [Turneriella sp.]HNL12102.1 UDP-3-O-(3-hydroxymyristoyl)glucosamine N-acyltransferase [Turneriella sp.]HNN00861.1 UDP-3-O-(3-hydroxymyristoyl)glucosamine N-acyltransferase [Turneriella sp.]